MAFFGLSSSLEEQRNKFYQKGASEEDVEVYTWGEAGYDGLGDALQEGNDDLNDETFGGSEPVGKDFDFSGQTQHFAPNEQHHQYQHQHQHQHQRKVSSQAPAEQHAPAPSDPRWDDRNALNAMLSRVGGSNRHAQPERAPPIHRAQSSHSSASHHQALQAPAPAEDIQAELLALSMRARQQERSQRNTPRPPMTMEEVEEQLLREQLARREQEQQQLLLLQQQQQAEQELLLRQQEIFIQQQRLQQQQQQMQLLQQQQLEYAAQHGAGHAHSQSHSRTFSEQALIQQQMQERLHMLRNDTQRQQAQIALQQHPEFLAMDDQQRAAILNEAQRKIIQTEQLEEKRRRRVIKMQRMSKYNDLMTQSDKDFITRIQVSQLVTEDPYVEDYYAQVYSSHLRHNGGGEERILKLGSGGVGLGMPGTRAGRRENAMQRMQQQVERIVKHAQQRDKEKATNALHYLQGALGKTAGRSYKAAPRQLLQVDNAANGSSSPKKAAGHISKEDAEDPAKNPAVLNAFNEQTTAQDAPLKPLDRHQVLIYIENLITTFLDVDLLRRRINADGPPELVAEVEGLAEKIYHDLNIMVPLEASEPHPFIVLLGPAKGKRIFPRLPGTFNSGQLTNVITLLLATFYQLDVVQNAHLLDTLDDSPQKAEAERQSQIFQECVIQTIGRVLATAPLGMVAGLLRVLVSRNVAYVAMSKPGLSLITELLNRAHVILQSSGPTSPDAPSPDELQAWTMVYNELFHALLEHLYVIFPSVRIVSNASTNPAYFSRPPHVPEFVDQHVWHFVALLAAHGNAAEHHSTIIVRIRDKVLENIKAIQNRWVASEEELLLKKTDINLLLNVIGLDASQIQV